MFVQVQSLCSTSNIYVDWTNTKNMCKTVEINTTDSSYGSKFWAELIIYWRQNLWDWELHEDRAVMMSSSRCCMRGRAPFRGFTHRAEEIVRADLCEMTAPQRVGQRAPSGVSWLHSPFHFPFQVNVPSTAINVELLLPRRGTCWGTSSCTLGKNRSNVPSAATPADGGTPSPDTSGPTPVSPPRLLFPLVGSFLTAAKVKRVVKITVFLVAPGLHRPLQIAQLWALEKPWCESDKLWFSHTSPFV